MIYLQVRTAAIFALGTYIFNSSADGHHSKHATSIDHTVAMSLLPLVTNGSPLVRMVKGLYLIYIVIYYIGNINSNTWVSGTV